MIDTLMVLWTSGTWKRFLRTTATFVLLFACLCVLLFLITTSGGRESGLAVTVAQSRTSTTQPTVQPTPAPTAIPTASHYIAPIILQNPVLPESASHTNRSAQRHTHHHYTSIFTQPTEQQPSAPTAPPPGPIVPPNNGIPDPTNPLQNLP